MSSCSSRAGAAQVLDAIDAIAHRTRRAGGARHYLAERGAANATPAMLLDPPYYSFRIFTLTAALCVAEAGTKAELKHIINNGGSVVPARGSGRKTFDWADKIMVQEGYQVLALSKNKLLSLRLGRHGREHDESL